MRRLSLSIVLVLLTASGLATAADGSEGRVQDDQGDVSLQHLVTVSGMPEEASAQEQVKLAGDITEAWVAGETDGTVTLTVGLANLSDNETVPSPLAEIWTHFTIGDRDYHVEAELATPQESQTLQARYQLYEGSTARAEPTGSLDRQADTITFTLEKTSIGDPQPGERLTRFHVTSHVPQEGLRPASSPVLDYAPSPQTLTVSQDTDPTRLDPTQLGLGPELTYGTPYEFGDYQGIDDLTVQASPSSLTVTAGQQGQIAINVVNDAPAADTVHLTTGNLPSGWSLSATTNEISLDSGEAGQSIVTIQPPSQARGQHLITLKVTSDLGADRPITVSASVQAPPQQDAGTQDGGQAGSAPGTGGAPATGGSNPSTGDAGGSQTDGAEAGAASEEENGAPFPAVGIVLAVLGALAWAVSHRRR